MIIRTTVGGGPNFAADAGTSGGGQSGTGASQGAPGNENADGVHAGAATSIPGGGSATGNQTGGGQSPANGGLARVLRPIPEAGAQGATGNENADGARADAATSIPGQTAGPPMGTVGPGQSNDSTNLPKWTSQLTDRLKTDPKWAAALGAFKSLDEFVQAYLDASAQAGGEKPPAIPGKESSPEEVQAFYERLGKPAKAEGYQFAKASPDFARFAFEQHLTTAQAEALYASSLAQVEATRKGIQANLARDIQATDAALQKEYGERYEEAMVLMGRGLGNNPKTGELSPIARTLVDAGLAARPEIVRAFIELGRATSEGSSASGRTSAPPADSVMNGRGFGYKDTYD